MTAPSSPDKQQPEAVYVWWSDLDQDWRIRKWDFKSFVQGTKYVRENVTQPSARVAPELAAAIHRMRCEWARADANDELPDFDGQDLTDVLAAAESSAPSHVDAPLKSVDDRGACPCGQVPEDMCDDGESRWAKCPRLAQASSKDAPDYKALYEAGCASWNQAFEAALNRAEKAEAEVARLSATVAAEDPGTLKIITALVERAYGIFTASGVLRVAEQDPDSNDPIVAWASDVRSILYRNKPAAIDAALHALRRPDGGSQKNG